MSGPLLPLEPLVCSHCEGRGYLFPRQQAPFEWCHKYDSCSRNWCPLDPNASVSQFEAIPPGTCVTDPEDHDPSRCPIAKSDRKRMVSRLPEPQRSMLRFGGLYADEFNRRKAAQERESKLSPAEREQRNARLLHAPAKSRTTKPGSSTPGSTPTTNRTAGGP
jgi:hypothetical protein